VSALQVGATAVHVLAAAAWLGAMLYSLFVLQPRAAAYFARPDDFERFVAAVSAGARWKVLGVAAAVGLSGATIAALGWRGAPSALALLVALKVALLVPILLIFGYASWRLWPARVMASRAEIPAYQAAFRRVGWSLILLVGAESVLGVLARYA
jgi:uncharacterized membrane protein